MGAQPAGGMGQDRWFPAKDRESESIAPPEASTNQHVSEDAMPARGFNFETFWVYGDDYSQGEPHLHGGHVVHRPLTLLPVQGYISVCHCRPQTPHARDGQVAHQGRPAAQDRARTEAIVWTLRGFGLVVLAAAAEALEVSLISILFPTVQVALSLAASDLGVIVAGAKLSAMLFSPIWIWLAGRWSRKGVIGLATCIAGGFGMALGFANSAAAFIVLSCASAAALSGRAPLITALLGDLFADGDRGRATGRLFAATSLMAAVSGTLFAQVSQRLDGWRAGFGVSGAFSVMTGLAILACLRDPGRGATDAASDAPQPDGRAAQGAAPALHIFRIASFNLMLLSRLLSGHLVIAAFGLLFLTSVRHFSNGTAALVLLPFSAGLCLGAVAGGWAGDRLNAILPRTGRIAFLQVAQFAFALVAFLAIWPDWSGIETYMAFWLALGFLQGVNPGVNRPIVLAVVPPRRRSWAFFVLLGLVEPAGWAAYSAGLSWIGPRVGLEPGLLIVLVGVMIVNGLAITPLYYTYGRDRDRMARREADWA